ncbi:hypothetical protein EJ377_22175 [Chryseobacterium arthrosphaerae]|uniref:Uncharacterized protein n=1 Tax=Chryseobacterium arthrosphaerae TaxID=651561 RepID=A0A432DUG6_9FLAO|nr:hypothetical protein EJ377_22175 [Chryseobacterium arthrosphaerae]
MNKDSAHAYIQSHNLIGIKAGAERPDFLEIWMVIVRNRIFARSWGLAERSWYTAFLKILKDRSDVAKRPAIYRQ